MYVIRDIFRLHFGHYRDAKTLVDEARKKNMMPGAKSLKLLTHVLTDAMSQGDRKMPYGKI
jgi:hypothetical protein